jgi:hypothetical protein
MVQGTRTADAERSVLAQTKVCAIGLQHSVRCAGTSIDGRSSAARSQALVAMLTQCLIFSRHQAASWCHMLECWHS